MREQPPEGWREVPLGKLGYFFRGRGGTRADEVPEGLPCIRYGDLYTHHGEVVRSFRSFISPASAPQYTLLQPGDVIFAGSGETPEEIGRAAAYCGAETAYAGADTIILQPGPDLNPMFAGYAVNSDAANKFKSRMAQGSSVFHISTENLRRLLLPLPHRVAQERIAETLATIDEAIEQTEALIAKTQQVKAGLMQDLFTRGVLPNGELRPPRSEAPQLYDQSAVGWIPAEWSDAKINNLLAKTAYPMRSGPFGSALLKEELVENGVPLLGIDNVLVEQFVAEYSRFVSPDKFRALRRYAVFSGDVIITIMGTVGRCCVVPDALGLALSSKHLWTMTFDANLVVPELVCWQLNSAPWAKAWFSRQSQGGIMQAIQSSTLRNLHLPVPPMEEQRRILERYQTVCSQTSMELEHLTKLQHLKRGLMHDLLTGRVHVPASLLEGASRV